MNFKSIHVIVNPASGKEEPILSYLNKSFNETGIDWDISVTKPNEEVYNIAKSLIGKAEVIGIYGGDGSVTEVARALKGTNVPLVIIPGGTANVAAKELGLPQDSLEAIQLIASGKTKVIAVDMGDANDQSFFLRINFGILANMILQADRQMKDQLGQVAYGVTAIKNIANTEPDTYKMIIDGKEIIETGVALTITNAGNIGIGDYSFLPDISITDGFLDVLLLHDADLMSCVRLAGSTLFKTDSNVLKHWKCKEITISMPQTVSYIRDDCEAEAKSIHIKVNPASLNVIVPLDYAR